MKKRITKYLCAAIFAALTLSISACGKDQKEPDSVLDTAPEQPPMDMVEEEPDAGDDLFDDFDDQDEFLGGWSEEMTALKAAVTDELGGEYWPDMEMAPEYLEMNYGITSDLYDDYMGEMPMMSVKVDAMLIVKAKDGKAADVEQKLNDYRKTLVESTSQYPSNIGKIQASKVETFGDYVCFVMLGGDITEAEENGDEAIIAYCTEQNEKALNAISQKVQ